MATTQNGCGDLWACGYTLVELVFTLGVLAILAAIALPNWGTLLPSYYLNSATRQVESELHRIKSQAVSENTGYNLNVPSAQATQYEVKKGTVLVATKPLPDGIQVTKAVTISFTSRGTASADRVRLLNSQNACAQVIVSPTGRIRTCKGDACDQTC